MEAEFGPDEVTVAATDLGADQEPTAQPAAEAVSGRGLRMVELLSLKWGSEPTGTGRRVRAALPVAFP